MRQDWTAGRLGGWAVALASVLAGAALGAQSRPAATYVTSAATALVTEGLAQPPPVTTAGFEDVPAPSLQNAPNTTGFAQVTLAPWVESNGWRFQRGLTRANYRTLPQGAAGLAAAEAFAFNVDAILNPDAADVQELGSILRFLKPRLAPALPALANAGVVDDGSPAMGEVLNMLTRRNLLYRVVTRPERDLHLTVQLGTRDFPKESATNPSDFAARVREKIGDDNRLVRLYGTTTVIARLTGDATRARLVLLSYSRNRAQQDIRVRLLGKWKNPSLAAYGADAATLVDVKQLDKAMEFGIATFNTIAIVDLIRM